MRSSDAVRRRAGRLARRLAVGLLARRRPLDARDDLPDRRAPGGRPTPPVAGSGSTDGQLSNAQVGSATTIGQSVFELACLTEGWFYFTMGAASFERPASRVGRERCSAKCVRRWTSGSEIRSVVPVDALVSLSPTPPGHDVQIRSDQWQVLTTVGHDRQDGQRRPRRDRRGPDQRAAHLARSQCRRPPQSSPRHPSGRLGTVPTFGAASPLIRDPVPGSLHPRWARRARSRCRRHRAPSRSRSRATSVSAAWPT